MVIGHPPLSLDPTRLAVRPPASLSSLCWIAAVAPLSCGLWRIKWLPTTKSCLPDKRSTSAVGDESTVGSRPQSLGVRRASRELAVYLVDSANILFTESAFVNSVSASVLIYIRVRSHTPYCDVLGLLVVVGA